MNLSDTLIINPLGLVEGFHTFALVGSIDAHTGPVLETLHTVPENSLINLDFKEVERVNSMGLALLLKLFEQWEKRGVKVEVSNLNRMVGMLFKITGLGRFLKTDPNAAPQSRPQPEIVSSVRNPETPAPQTSKSEAATIHHGKLTFIASMQTGAQLSGWYLLNTYLQRRLQQAIHLEQLPAGHEINHESVDILFAKPFEACAMIEKRGFLPLLRPVGEADEVVIVMRSDDARELSSLTDPLVVTASQGSFVYLLGRFLCDENGIDSNTYRYAFAGNEIKALQMLLKGQADLLFMLKKTYHGLSGLTRKSTRVADESDTQFAFHLFCINPRVAPIRETLVRVLEDMGTEENGQGILKDIQIEGWCPPEEAEVRMLRQIYQRYSVPS